MLQNVCSWPWMTAFSSIAHERPRCGVSSQGRIGIRISRGYGAVVRTIRRGIEDLRDDGWIDPRYDGCKNVYRLYFIDEKPGLGIGNQAQAIGQGCPIEKRRDNTAKLLADTGNQTEKKIISSACGTSPANALARKVGRRSRAGA